MKCGTLSSHSSMSEIGYKYFAKLNGLAYSFESVNGASKSGVTSPWPIV